MENFYLILLLFLKFFEIIEYAEKNISLSVLSDISNVIATVVIAWLGYRYTKNQDKKIENVNKIERLTNYQSIISVDNTKYNNIKLDIDTLHNYTIDSDKSVLKSSNGNDINGVAYAFNLEIALKSFSETLPTQIRIKNIKIFDTSKNKKINNFKHLFLDFVNIDYTFKTLAFNQNKILLMDCLCCMTNDEYKKLGEHDFKDNTINIAITYEVKNQFNIVTGLDTRILFDLIDFEDIGSNNLGGQKVRANLKLIDAYSNITATYEDSKK